MRHLNVLKTLRFNISNKYDSHDQFERSKNEGAPSINQRQAELPNRESEQVNEAKA